MKKVSLNAFIKDLRASFKHEYGNAIWPIGGFFIIFVALSFLLTYFTASTASSIMMSMMYVMMGMASAGAIGLALLEVLAGIVLMLVVDFFYGFIQVAFQYAYLDRFRNPDHKVTASSIWNQYKHANKNQLWRLTMYLGLFTFLWTLPLNIVAGIFAKNVAVAITCRVLNLLIVIWKGLQYSQSFFVYNDRRPQFLGQSMRHAITASKRYMKGLNWNFLLVILVTVILPIVVWAAIFGGLGYYGIYTATNFWIWFGFIVAFVGVVAWLPVSYATTALYYQQTADGQNLDADFDGTFKPVEELTGEAFKNDNSPKTKTTTKSKDKKSKDNQ